MKNNDVKLKISQMEKKMRSLKTYLRKYEKDLTKKELEGHVFDAILIRNIHFVTNTCNKISDNFKFVEEVTVDNNKLEFEQKDLINKKMLTSFLLLETLIDINNGYDIEKFDYEVLSLKVFDNPIFKKKKNMLYTDFTILSKKEIEETFNDIKVEVKEPLIFTGIITILLYQLVTSGENVLKGMQRIYKFFTELLKDFLDLLFKLLEMFIYLITVVIPKLITMTWDFIKGLFNRLSRVGYLLPLFIPLMIIVMMISLILLSGTPFTREGITNLINIVTQPKNVPDVRGLRFGLSNFVSKNEIPLSLIITATKLGFYSSIWIFWFKTEIIESFGKSLLNMLKFIFSVLINTSKIARTFFLIVLGENENSKMFRRDTPEEEKLSLFTSKVIKEAPIILVRFLVVIFILKYTYENLLPIKVLIDNFPSLREISLVPFVIIRDIINFTGIKIILPPYN